MIDKSESEKNAHHQCLSTNYFLNSRSTIKYENADLQIWRKKTIWLQNTYNSSRSIRHTFLKVSRLQLKWPKQSIHTGSRTLIKTKGSSFMTSIGYKYQSNWSVKPFTSIEWSLNLSQRSQAQKDKTKNQLKFKIAFCNSILSPVS